MGGGVCDRSGDGGCASKEAEEINKAQVKEGVIWESRRRGHKKLGDVLWPAGLHIFYISN